MEDINQWREELGTLHQQAETSLLIVDAMSGVLIESACGSCACVFLSVRVCAAGHGGCQEKEEGLAAEATRHEAKEPVAVKGLFDGHGLHPDDGCGEQ